MKKIANLFFFFILVLSILCFHFFVIHKMNGAAEVTHEGEINQTIKMCEVT